MIVYGDFNCLYSYLASMQVDALVEAQQPAEWRAVEHAPTLPVTGRRLDAASQAELDDEIRRLRSLAPASEKLPDLPAVFVPNTQAAVAGYAEAFGAGVGDQVRRLLFEAYWVRGLDIGSPEVLRSLLASAIRGGTSTAFPLHEAGFAVSTNRNPITLAAYRRIRDWDDAWKRTNARAMPAVLDGAAVFAGQDALTRLAALVPHSNLTASPTDVPVVPSERRTRAAA